MGTMTSAHRPAGANRKACHRSPSFFPVTQLSVLIETTYGRPSARTRKRSAVNASRSRNSPGGRSAVLHPAKPLRFRDRVTWRGGAEVVEVEGVEVVAAGGGVADDAAEAGRRSSSAAAASSSSRGRRPGPNGSAAGSSSPTSGATVFVLRTPSRTMAPTSSSPSEAAAAGSVIGVHVSVAVDVPPWGSSDHARHPRATSAAVGNDVTISFVVETGETSATSRAKRAARRAQLRTNDAIRGDERVPSRRRGGGQGGGGGFVAATRGVRRGAGGTPTDVADADSQQLRTRTTSARSTGPLEHHGPGAGGPVPARAATQLDTARNMADMDGDYEGGDGYAPPPSRASRTPRATRSTPVRRGPLAARLP